MSDSKRKLAAIVFTDIVGFTNLTSKNQQKASDLLDIQRDLLKPLVESYSGRWVKEMGDGLILTFDTINNAVECCLKIQEKSKEIDNLVLRIGIHLGEILEKEKRWPTHEEIQTEYDKTHWKEHLKNLGSELSLPFAILLR